MYGDKSIQARMDLLFIVLLSGMSTFLNRIHAIEYTITLQRGKRAWHHTGFVKPRPVFR